MESATLQLALELLSRPSITPQDHGCQTIIAKRLAKIGFDIHTMPVNQVSNLFAIKGQNKPLFCFAGHTDVVPPGDLAAWHTPPFSPSIRKGILYARGAADMKCSIAAMITACERLNAQYPDLSKGIAFLITSDEEGPAVDGTQAVLKTLCKKNTIPQWCLVGEASSQKQLADTIKIGRRGTLTGTLILHGIQGHVAYPHLAKNPIHMALPALHQLINQQWDTGNAHFEPTSLQISHLQAGSGANNVIPQSMEVVFNLRYSPLLTHEAIQKEVEHLFAKANCDFTLDWHHGGKPFYTKNGKLLQTVHNVIKQECGFPPLHSTAGGTSDGRFFAEYGVQVVELGPVNASIHQVNECIEVEALLTLSQLYEKILFALMHSHYN